MSTLDMFPDMPSRPSAKTMHFTAFHLKAIKWYCTHNDLRLAISAFPVVTCVTKDTHQEVNEDIITIVDEYRQNKKEEQRERARARRLREVRQ